MYKELEAELARRGWTKKDLSEKTKIRYGTLLMKLNGSYELTYNESVKIKKALGTTMPLEVLFFNQ